MKILFTSAFFLGTFLFGQAQSGIVWSENFNQTSSSCDPEDPPFNWNITDIGAQGSDANYWYIDTTVNCFSPNTCFGMDTSSINRALFISIGNTCDSALWGPIYKKGCDNTTDKRAESPTIDCSGKSNLFLEFDFLVQGYYPIDIGTLCYSADGGSSWTDLTSLHSTGSCPAYGRSGAFWKHAFVPLPSSADNNPDVKIGFRWENNDDCFGQTYSIAVDNLQLATSCNADISVTAINICPGSCVVFGTSAVGVTSCQWSFPGGTPNHSSALTPSICYNTPGQYDVSIIMYDGCPGVISLASYINVYPQPPPQGITQNYDTLFANQGASSYQWYYNNNPISGATDFYLPTYSIGDGDYSVIVTDENGCEAQASANNIISHPYLALDVSHLKVSNEGYFPNSTGTYEWYKNSVLYYTGSSPCSSCTGTTGDVYYVVYTLSIAPHTTYTSNTFTF